MKKFIQISRKDRDFIAKTFGITDRMVGKGLYYESYSALAKRIRTLALQRGGVIMNVVPEVETIHDAGGLMMQTFADGARLFVNKETGLVTLLRKNETVPVKGWNNPTITEFEKIQRMAAQLVGAVDEVGVVGR